MRQTVINLEDIKKFKIYCKARYRCIDGIMFKVLESEKDNQILSVL